MIPPLILLRNVFAATAAGTLTASFLWNMDCNPAVFWFDKLQRRRSYYQNKCVWIIGASSGIGEELAYQLTDAGCLTLILSSRSHDRLQIVANACRQRNPACQCHVLQIDVSQTSSIQQAVERLPPCKLDIVFLNAGRGHLSPALETSPETCHQVMQLNAIWPMILTPLLFQRKVFWDNNPHLVITSSIAGRLGVPLSAAYAASKYAVMGYFASLQAERPDLRIDLMCPGPVDTNFHQNHVAKHERQKQKSSSTKLKMPVDRCVQIMLSATSMKGSGREVWIAQQPTLLALYLNQFTPGLVRWLLSRIGPRRVEMWQQGLDLYDPASWRKGNKQPTSSKEASSPQR